MNFFYLKTLIILDGFRKKKKRKKEKMMMSVSKISPKNFIFWKHPPFAHKHITLYKHISKYFKTI